MEDLPLPAGIRSEIIQPEFSTLEKVMITYVSYSKMKAKGRSAVPYTASGKKIKEAIWVALVYIDENYAESLVQELADSVEKPTKELAQQRRTIREGVRKGFLEESHSSEGLLPLRTVEEELEGMTTRYENTIRILGHWTDDKFNPELARKILKYAFHEPRNLENVMDLYPELFLPKGVRFMLEQDDSPLGIFIQMGYDADTISHTLTIPDRFRKHHEETLEYHVGGAQVAH